MQVCRNDCLEAGRAKLLGVKAEPAEPDSAGTAVESFGFNKDLERHALQAGRVTKMIKISEQILDFEPDYGVVRLAYRQQWGRFCVHPKPPPPLPPIDQREVVVEPIRPPS